jgi:cytochrome c oxidase subunit 4
MSSQHHIVTPKTYITILLSLMVLMGLTIAASKVHVGPEGVHVYNLLIALAIACAKMSLILLFFMHVKYGSKLAAVFATGGFFWLIIFFVLMMADYFTRENWISPVVGSPYGG